MKEYQKPLYLNYDSIEDRQMMRDRAWLLETDLIVFDELHKMPKWKNYLKGVYDTKSTHLHILVTGSARLETFRRAGDSLAGRFFVHHLLPVSLQELTGTPYSKNLDRLLERGGFPEPFLVETVTDAERWRQGYTDSLLREDILSFAEVEKLGALQLVFDILRAKVGSPVSYANIAQDIGISPVTVKRYVQLLEALYIIYTLPPFTQKISRAISKERKVYFYDTGLVRGDKGVVFENEVANSLLKYATHQNDTLATELMLCYLRTKEGKEVDFVIAKKGEMKTLIEVKLSDKSLSPGLVYFGEKYRVPGVQVVKNLPYGKSFGAQFGILEARDFLENLQY
jgi:predicted AAA+ superfamily ATPase